MAFNLKYPTGLTKQQAAQDVFVDGGEAGDGGKFDVLVDLVDAFIHRAKLDEFAGNGFDKAAVRCAAAGGEFRAHAADFGNGGLRGFRQPARFGQEGLAGQTPLQIVIQTVFVQDFVYAPFQAV